MRNVPTSESGSRQRGTQHVTSNVQRSILQDGGWMIGGRRVRLQRPALSKRGDRGTACRIEVEHPPLYALPRKGPY
jgi:hypothetical protein